MGSSHFCSQFTLLITHLSLFQSAPGDHETRSHTQRKDAMVVAITLLSSIGYSKWQPQRYRSNRLRNYIGILFRYVGHGSCRCYWDASRENPIRWERLTIHNSCHDSSNVSYILSPLHTVVRMHSNPRRFLLHTVDGKIHPPLLTARHSRRRTRNSGRSNILGIQHPFSPRRRRWRFHHKYFSIGFFSIQSFGCYQWNLFVFDFGCGGNHDHDYHGQFEKAASVSWIVFWFWFIQIIIWR